MKKQSKILTPLTIGFALFLGAGAVASPAFAATHNPADQVALGIIIPALVICLAIIVELWRTTTNATRRTSPVRVRKSKKPTSK
ncbi:hypothetical protein MXMO3_01309 [Maritalea myrionectae]|uniref:Secreted protein n=1 Tax=Maritalea myrionectae TaxID=454601 RepID=A0A2R4MCV9_9HYPH|nr:hypothetical protein [Maritalea myrionectae]AVX03840.1 hypothetical protein MXMO3_01309 [Maritalea myrionectae]